jgi:signal transduction histidine kinase
VIGGKLALRGRAVSEASVAFLASVAFFLLTAAIPIRGHVVAIVVLGAVYVYVVLLAARRRGPSLAVPLAIAGGLGFDSFYIPPTREFGASDWQNWLVMAIYISMGVLIGVLAGRSQRRAEALAREQEALRRVATLVAEAASPDAVFSAVAREVSRAVLGADVTLVGRYDSDEVVEFVGGWSRDGEPSFVGERVSLGGHNASTLVFERNGPARVDHLTDEASPATALARRWARSSAGAPINVEGRLWGVMTVGSLHPEGLPTGVESRLASFSEQVATAIANAQARVELRTVADEQAALRRVATQVVRGVPAAGVFAAVARELERLFDAQATTIGRLEHDGTMTVVASSGTQAEEMAVGARLKLESGMVLAKVVRTGRPARVDDYSDASERLGRMTQPLGIRCSVAAPILVEGALWGALGAAKCELFPVDTEQRVAKFTELVGTAISDIQARSDLAASRARIVAAADGERRRVVRDLHDGAQQRLVHTIITLKLATRASQSGEDGVPALLNEALDHAQQANVELRELAHGILPAALTQGGLRAGVDTLASRMPVPVEIDVSVGRLPTAVEATGYFVVAEALTNVAKHARAECAKATVRIEDGTLEVEVRDDGVGGARPEGSGLVGLADRLAVLDGHLRIESPADGGTLVAASIPLPH